MRVFLSWSGSRSNQVAQVLRDWLPGVIQATRPYFSPDDIAKGARWNTEISLELQESKIGILCVTAENLTAPWLMFEAGALAKSLDSSRVIPLLIDVEPSDLIGPLSQFQAAKFDRVDLRRLTKVINGELGASALDDAVLDTVFEKWWPELESAVKAILAKENSAITSPPRPDREVLDEILDHVRDISFRRPKSLGLFSLFADRDIEPIETLELSDRITTDLKFAGITSIGALLTKSENDLLHIPPIGRRALNEIKFQLQVRGLHLRESATADLKTDEN